MHYTHGSSSLAAMRPEIFVAGCVCWGACRCHRGVGRAASVGLPPHAPGLLPAWHSALANASQVRAAAARTLIPTTALESLISRPQQRSLSGIEVVSPVHMHANQQDRPMHA
jgi:hypothetical protein